MTLRNSPAQTIFAKALRRSQTDAKKLLWRHLSAKRLAGIKFRGQEPIGPYVVGFLSREHKLIVEIDRGHHNEDAEQKKDEERSTKLCKEGFTVLRFWNNEVLENLTGVLEKIQEAVSKRDLSSSP